MLVYTAEKLVGLLRNKGVTQAAREVDVVTTGTLGPMCFSGAYFNIKQSTPKITCSGGRASFNGGPVYTGWAAAGLYLGCTALPDKDPRKEYTTELGGPR